MGHFDGQQWAVAMYDATAKSSAGVTSGSLYQFGHFDGCLKQTIPENVDSTTVIESKYCLADVALDGVKIPDFGRRFVQPNNRTIVHWGACVPASCGANDIAIYMQHLLQRQVTVDDEMCQVRHSMSVLTTGMIAYAYVISCFIFLAFLSTAFHIYTLLMADHNEKLTKILLRNENLTIILFSFSIIENTKKIFQASKDQLGLNCINGVKALSMLLILIGHGLSFIYGGPIHNADFMSERVKYPIFAFLPNSLLFVDTFLLLSGFLFCRIMLIEMERRRGKINPIMLYVARYTRLTPAYMVVIGFYMTWFVKVGNGPLWQQRISQEQDRCIGSWWLNILYVNNYFNTDKLCMFQSWYLSVDSQLFFIGPIFIFLLYKAKHIGVKILSAAVIVAALVPFLITYIQKLGPTLLVFADEMTDLGTNSYYVDTYIKTHMRASAYAVGLLAGYLVHTMQKNRLQLPLSMVRVGSICSTLIGCTSMYSVSIFYNRPFTNLVATLYAGLHKLGWNLSVGWLVVILTTGHAKFLQKILSNRIFAPISRLCYCAYLCNGIVELYHSSSVQVPIVASYMNLANISAGHIINTFMLAYVLCLIFESPTHALERLLARKSVRNDRTVTQGTQDSPVPSTSDEQVA